MSHSDLVIDAFRCFRRHHGPNPALGRHEASHSFGFTAEHAASKAEACACISHRQLPTSTSFRLVLPCRHRRQHENSKNGLGCQKGRESIPQLANNASLLSVPGSNTAQSARKARSRTVCGCAGCTLHGSQRGLGGPKVASHASPFTAGGLSTSPCGHQLQKANSQATTPSSARNMHRSRRRPQRPSLATPTSFARITARLADADFRHYDEHRQLSAPAEVAVAAAAPSANAAPRG